MKKSKIPELLDHEGYAAATTKLEQLRERRASVQQQIEATRASFGATKADWLRAEVDALLADVPPEESPSDLKSRLAEFQHAAEVLDEAIRQQQMVVDNAHSDASRMICEAAFPAHRELVAMIDEVAKNLEALVLEEVDFRDAIQRSGARIVHPLSHAARMAFLFKDHATTRFPAWRAALVEAGYQEPEATGNA